MSNSLSATVELPPDVRWIGTARLVAAGAANPAGFDIDRVEDLALAVSEVLNVLVEAEGAGPTAMRVRRDLNGMALAFEATADEGVLDGAFDDTLAGYVVRSLASDFSASQVGRVATASFTMSADI